MIDPALAWILRLALALLFGAAALHKAHDLAAFVATLRDYRLLPRALARPAAGLLVAVEACVTLGLLAGAPVATLAAAGLLALYGLAMAWNLARGRRHIDCGCLGPAHRRTLSWSLVARNAALALGACALLLPASARTPAWPDALTVAGGVTMLALLWSAAQRLGAPHASGAAHALGRSW